MSAKIYFRTGPSQRLQRAIIALASSLHRKLAPKHALATAERILLTPTRLPAKNSKPDRMISASVNSAMGTLATYQLGSGPVWLLVHGWSGAAHQFFPLMQHIADRGYTALAFDLPAHGASDGQQAHLPAFIDAITTLCKGNSIAGVVAHSMGGAAVLQANLPALSKQPLLLIAPVLNYVENMYQTIHRSGYSMRLFEQVSQRISQQWQLALADIDPIARLHQRHGDCLIVHDPGDRLASFEVSQAACASLNNAHLIAADKQGHGRVMKCKATLAAFDQLAGVALNSAQGGN